MVNVTKLKSIDCDRAVINTCRITHTHIYIYIYIYMCVCVCVYVCVCVCLGVPLNYVKTRPYKSLSD